MVSIGGKFKFLAKSIIDMKRFAFLIVWIILTTSGCAGLNPNPGERTADIANESGNYDRALSIVKPCAERGEPWAQLRLGVYYEKGIAIEKDIEKSIYWYTKCAVQKGEGGWADGQIAGCVGKSGYFNQNTDALIAQWRLADLLLEGKGVKQDLVKAYLLVNNVIKESEGKSLFYCCEWMQGGGLYITPDMVAKTKEDVLKAMSEREKAEALSFAEKWTPQTGL